MSAAVESLFVTREPAWHGLGTVLPESPTSQDAIVAAGLDWRVEKNPIFDASGNQIDNFYANTKSDNGQVLGIVSSRYGIIQNQDAFSFTDSLVGEGLTYESAGALRDNKIVWLLGKLPTTDILGDDVEPYICFTNSFDGSGAVQVCCVHTRVCCMNTLNLALRTAKRKWSTRHIGNIQSKLHEAQVTLGLAKTYIEELSIESEKLAAAKIKDADLEAILDEMYPVNETDTDSRKNKIQKLKDDFFICLSATDIKKFRGTKYAAIMAATDFADHGEPLRRTQNFEQNRWYNVMQGHPFVDNFYKKLAA